MKKYVIGILLIFVLLISACTSLDPLALVKANSQVQQFLKDYPNADLLMTRLNAEQIADENIVVKEVCGIELEEKPYYKVKIMDPDSDLEIYAYIDIETEDMVCLRKIGKEVVEKIEQEKEQEEEREYEKEYEESYECNSPDDCKGMNHDMCEGYWKCLDHKCRWICKEIVEEYECKQASDCEGMTHDACEGQWYCKNYDCVWKCSEACTSEVKLEGIKKEDTVVLEWTPYKCSDFVGYKIVWSDEVEHPKYPEHHYIKYSTSQEKNRYEEEFRAMHNYYAITVLLDDGKVYSNPVEIVVEDYNESEEEEEPEEEIDYDAVLEYGFTEEDVLVLEWNAYPNNDLSYYKVVWSQTNIDLMYPGDSYISVISNAATTRYEVPEDKFLNGTNYYRISAIRNGFYPSKDTSKRINSNVVTVEK